MDRRPIQFLAALANDAKRERFAQVCLAGEGGLRSDSPTDRLLIDAGAIVSDAGFVRVDKAGIKLLLEAVRACAPERAPGPVERLPRRRSDRVSMLNDLAASVLARGERLRERELGERLSARVTDVALFRRAMIDDGILGRNAATQEYWLSDVTSEHGDSHP